MTPEQRALWARLSLRQQEALLYVANGYTYARTARKMRVERDTVAHYLTLAYDRLGVGSLIEACAVLGWLVAPERREDVA